MSGAASSTCSKLSSTIRSRRPALATPSCSESGRVARVAHPELPRDRRERRRSGSRTCSRDTNVTPVERRAGVARDLDREAALADPAGADEGDEALRVLAQPGEQRR